MGGLPAPGIFSSADIQAIKAYVYELETRLTAARAGYLDAAISSRVKAYEAFQTVDYINADPVNNTWYTALDVTGSGCLHSVYFPAMSSQAQELRVTVDGAAYTWTEQNTYARDNPFMHRLKFDSSLKVEARITSGDNYSGTMRVHIDYSTS